METVAAEMARASDVLSSPDHEGLAPDPRDSEPEAHAPQAPEPPAPEQQAPVAAAGATIVPLRASEP